MLIGAGGLERLAAARVTVVGIGGVGAAAAEMLVRAGVGHLTIIDSDSVSESNINRQLLALHSTVGLPKTSVLSSRLLDINPSLDLHTVSEYLHEDNIPSIIPGRSRPKNNATLGLEGGPQAERSGGANEVSVLPVETGLEEVPDFVVDAIDTLSPKIALIQYCLKEGIPMVSSMGSGAKIDATAVKVADISKTFQCPLAHMLRKRLHKLGITTGFQAVFSPELPRKDSLVIEESRNKKSQVGTISYLPTVFGCVCAQVAVRHFLGI